MDIFLTILVYLCPEGLEKTAIDFSNSTFRIEAGIIKLFIFRVLYFVISYSWKCLTSMTVLKYDDVIKKSHDLDYYFGIFFKDLI